MNKKGVIPLFILVILAVTFIGFPIAGIITFLVSDKTPLIFLAIFIFLFALKKKRREGQ